MKKTLVKLNPQEADCVTRRGRGTRDGETLREKLAGILHKWGMCRGGEYGTSECNCLETTDELLPIIRVHAAEVARTRELHWNGEPLGVVRELIEALEKMS